jgi:hypothetical protein
LIKGGIWNTTGKLIFRVSGERERSVERIVCRNPQIKTAGTRGLFVSEVPRTGDGLSARNRRCIVATRLLSSKSHIAGVNTVGPAKLEGIETKLRKMPIKIGTVKIYLFCTI